MRQEAKTRGFGIDEKRREETSRNEKPRGEETHKQDTAAAAR